jgi:hypothetical protein
MAFDYDVAVYMGSLPKIKNHNLKVQIMRAFAEGATKQGARVFVGDLQRKLVSARLAVIIGWVGMNFSGPHIYFRRDIIEHQKRIGGRVMSIDGSCFKFSHSGDLWLRYSLDSVFYNEGEYANRNASPAHWEKIAQSLHLQFMPWRNKGEHILICLQRDSGWNAKGFDQPRWLKKTLKILSGRTDRRIVIRPHPSNQINWQKHTWGYNAHIVNPLQTSIMDNIKGAHAGIFYNSSSSVASVLSGVPVFVTDESAVTWQVANSSLKFIENPEMPDRTQWLNDLSQAHWTIDHARTGEIYRHFLPYLPT